MLLSHHSPEQRPEIELVLGDAHRGSKERISGGAFSVFLVGVPEDAVAWGCFGVESALCSLE